MTPQQGPGGEPQNRVAPVGGNLREGHEDEAALLHERMRQDQGPT